jgi:pyruvate-formate lyase-activating enzyme
MMMHIITMVVVVVRHTCPFCHNPCIYRKYRRMIVSVPLGSPLDHSENNHTQYQKKTTPKNTGNAPNTMPCDNMSSTPCYYNIQDD